MGIIVECTCDQCVKIPVTCFPCGCYKVRAAYGAEFGADEYGCPFFCACFLIPFDINALGTDKMPGPGGYGDEIDLVFLMCLLHSCGFEVFQDYFCKVCSFGVCVVGVYKLVIFIHSHNPVRGNAFHGKRPGYADFLFVFIRLVIKIFRISFGCNGCVNLFLPVNSEFPPLGMNFFDLGRPFFF